MLHWYNEGIGVDQPKQIMTGSPSESVEGTMAPCNVLVVDDHPCVFAAIEVACRKAGVTGKLKHVMTARQGRAALADVRHTSEEEKFQLVIVDLDLPDMAGVDFIRIVQQLHPEVKIFVYTAKRYEMFACRLNAMHIAGFLNKFEAMEKVGAAIGLVAQGFHVKPCGGAGNGDNPFDLLSNRELSVAMLIAKGNSNRMIAQQLSISQKTVAVHKMNLLRKLCCESAIDVAQMAQLHGLG
ncbi:response regulator transcription factor [Robbsia andropogonis]